MNLKKKKNPWMIEKSSAVKDQPRSSVSISHGNSANRLVGNVVFQ